MNRQSGALIAVSLLLGATLAASNHLGRRIPGRLAAPLHNVREEIAGWRAVGDRQLEDSTLGVLRASKTLSRLYSKNGDKLELFVAYYAEQRAGETMHSPKNCLPGTGWEIWKPGSAAFEVSGTPVRVNMYGIENAGIRNVVFYWYQSANRIVSSEYLAKLLLARDTLFTGRTDGSIVRVVLPDRPGASEAGISFVKAVIPEIQRCLGR